ncbi:MAG: PAS domain-containing protein, partial [Acidimicrobiia bacterium]|nr:PAS domain-containing protein [Acidimicrobiia bacterium]
MAPVGEALLDAFAPPLVIDGPAPVDFVVSQESVVDGVAVAVTDPANGIARLVHVNQGLAAMVGRSAADLSGRPLLSLLGSDAHRATLAS